MHLDQRLQLLRHGAGAGLAEPGTRPRDSVEPQLVRDSSSFIGTPFFEWWPAGQAVCDETTVAVRPAGSKGDVDEDGESNRSQIAFHAARQSPTSSWSTARR